MRPVYAAVQIANEFSPARSFPTFGSLVSTLVVNIFVLGGVVAFLFLIFGGVKIILSAGGDSKSLSSGKATVTAAILGLFIIVFSYWIVQIIEIITGIDLLGGSLLS